MSLANDRHTQKSGFAWVCGFLVLCSYLLVGTGAATAAETTPKPLVALSLNGSADVTARKGWPFIFEVALMHPQAFASPTNGILIASTGNVWSAAIRIEIRDAQGQLQLWPLHLRQTPAASIELDGQFLGRLQWLLSPIETGLLTAGKYELRAILDTTETSVADAWKGTARSVPVALDLGEPVTEPDAIEFENQQKLFARDALMIGDRDLALSNIDALLNRYPTNIGGLTYKAFLLADRGDRVGALALCDQALQQVYAQDPNPQEPPEVLLKLQHDLIDQLLAPIVIRSVEVQGPSLVLVWNANSGEQYTVETSSDLKTWSVVALNLLATGETRAWTNTLGANAAFFRVKR